MNDPGRDFQLLAAKAAVWDSVSGTAMATIAVLRDNPAWEGKTKAKRNLALAGEMMDRFATFVTTIKPLGMEYSPTMSEADLRAWAARVAEALRG